MQYQFTQSQIERWMGQEVMKVKALEERNQQLEAAVKQKENEERKDEPV